MHMFSHIFLSLSHRYEIANLTVGGTFLVVGVVRVGIEVKGWLTVQSPFRKSAHHRLINHKTHTRKHQCINFNVNV